MVDVAPRDAQGILQSLQAGVVPRTGLQHLAVGRVAEIRQALAELEVLRDGGGVFKIVVGDYGSGKTFFLTLVRQVALARGYLVADADLGPDLRFRGEDRGLATYRQLVARLGSEARPAGGALPLVLDRWAERVRAGAALRLDAPEGPAAGGGLDLARVAPGGTGSLGAAASGSAFRQGHPGAPGPTERTPAWAAAVDRELRARLRPLQDQPAGFAFAAVLRHYYEAALAGDDDGMAAALRFFRGEYRMVSAARAELRLPTVAPITDASWVEHLRLLALLAVDAGYAGLLAMCDEGVNLVRIAQPEARAANYEVLLRLLNDALQGRAPHLGFYLAGPPEMVSDPRRGLHSYPALRSRLQANPFADAAHRDLTQPVLLLPPLSAEELLALLLKVRALHVGLYGPSPLSEEDTAAFLQRLLSRPGAERFLTVRETLRAFIQASSVLQQNPELDRVAVLGEAESEITAQRFVEVALE